MKFLEVMDSDGEINIVNIEDIQYFNETYLNMRDFASNSRYIRLAEGESEVIRKVLYEKYLVLNPKQ